MSDEKPWWEGTVIPTGQYRLKVIENCSTGRLQHLVRPTSGGKGRWVDIKIVAFDASDDEY